MADVTAIAVIACGNRVRSDDGVGPEVVRVLRERGMGETRDVRLLDAGTDGMAVLYSARGCRTLVIIDASRSGSTPGTVFEAPGAALEQQGCGAFTLHEFRWNHALYAGRRIYGDAFPMDVTVLLVEAADIGIGVELSPAVQAAVIKVADRIEELVHQRLIGCT